MPVAKINLLKGHQRETLRQILVEVSEAMSRILKAPEDRLIISINEVDLDLQIINGRIAREALELHGREAVEIPFVQMVLMEGRPKEQLHQIIQELTAIISKATKVDPQRIRVHINLAQPDTWGIGGVPASILRKAELDARAKLAS
jgi:4-oxalocrotonate tautomerase family enzyme